MTVLLVFLHRLALSSRLLAVVPALDPATAYAHASAACAAATPQISPELLLGVAYVESRYDPTATSRVVAGVRHTGSYPSRRPPARLDRHASLYCGPLQTYAGSWRQCLAARDLRTAYAAGARELTEWLDDRRVRGNLAHALAGHGCGNFGVTTGRCNGYPARVLGMAYRLRRGARLPRRVASS